MWIGLASVLFTATWIKKVDKRLACLPVSAVVIGSIFHWRNWKIDLGFQADPAKIEYQRSLEVMAVCMIFTLSPGESWMVCLNMNASTMYPVWKCPVCFFFLNFVVHYNASGISECMRTPFCFIVWNICNHSNVW